MGTALQHRVELWKRLLLDLGKRNRLINFKEGKRNNVKIITPSFEELYNSIVVNEKGLSFPFAKRIVVDEDGEESYDAVIPGNIETSRAIGDLQKTLRALRQKGKTSIEEQGINILYLTFGSIRWKESEMSDQHIISPLVLVPVRLTIESATSPYMLSLHDDEIVVNPSLAHKFENDFNILIPEFDSSKDEICQYLTTIEELVKNNGWSVSADTHLTVLSFLKINMYKDLERHEEKLNHNGVLAAMVGECEPITISGDMDNYDHDNKTLPIDTFQVVDADSSQQDAVLLSKSGVSFVLQGPPGTGKSQTITNIISEALADGKKVLFVSEKMAALQVVYNRLSSVGLADYCFALHSHKAKKKDILRDLSNSISIDRKRVRDEVLVQLDNLERRRNHLNQYQLELHTECSALNCTIFEVNGRLAKLSNAPDVVFEIADADQTTQTELNERRYALAELSTTIGKRSEDYNSNVWRNADVEYLSNELRHDIDSRFGLLLPTLHKAAEILRNSECHLGLTTEPTFDNIVNIMSILEVAGRSPLVPTRWVFDDDITYIQREATELQSTNEQILSLRNNLLTRFKEVVLSVDANNLHTTLCNNTLFISDLLIIREDEIEVDYLNELKGKLFQLSNSHIAYLNSSKAIASLLNLNEPTTFADVLFLQELAGRLCVEIQPTKMWFKEVKFAGFLSEQEGLHTRLTADLNKIDIQFNDSILEEEVILSIVNGCNDTIGTTKAAFKYLDNSTYHTEGFVADNAESTHKVATDSLLAINTLRDKISRVAKTLSIPVSDSFLGVERFINFLRGALIDYKATALWFDKDNYASIVDIIQQMSTISNEIIQLKTDILKQYDNEILDLDYLGILKRFRASYDSIFRVFNSAYRKDLNLLKQVSHNPSSIKYSTALLLLTQLKDIDDKQLLITKESKKLTSMFGAEYNGVDTDWAALSANVSNFHTFIDNFAEYVTTVQVKGSLVNRNLPSESIEDLIRYYEGLNIPKLRSNISTLVGKDSNHMPGVVKTLEGVTATLDKLSTGKNNVLQLLSVHSKFDGDFKYEQYTDIAETLVSIKNLRIRIADNKTNYTEYFGEYYNGGIIQWDRLHDDVDKFNSIISLFATSTIPHHLKSAILAGTIDQSSLMELQEVHCEFDKQNLIAETNLLLKTKVNNDVVVCDLIESLVNIKNTCANSVEICDAVVRHRETKCNYLEIVSELKLCSTHQTLVDTFKQQEADLQKKFESYYDGTRTDWKKLLNAILYTQELKKAIIEHSLPEQFIEKICTNHKAVSLCQEYYIELQQIRMDATSDFEWVVSLFKSKVRLGNLHIGDLIDKLSKCKDNKHLLEEWVDYRANRRRCNELKLSAFVDKIDVLDIAPIDIVDTYLKRFYRLWLDAVIPQFPAIQSFRGRVQDQMIQEFRELDRAQFKIAQSRVRERVMNRIPDFNSVTSTRDEVGILKRELNKQRRIMPLRKLFAAIPNLITSLRPCFMMSPLSVSLFLEADSYEFDMVIFDEASQVHTEDAVGAIMRGKQVIIVGDTKQLPPTAFFANSISDEGYDSGDEDSGDEDAGAYQSILDEAVVILPERSLRWHYRSRHEDLITFSNVKIYNNSLITFPSSIEKAADCGVEYIHVSNGVYERGTKRSNTIEARKVADLVFEHYRKHPNRSLGVVTFSEAQMHAVDGAIRHKRQLLPRYDRFFAEDINEPFFVKNIESVQGDERDTIIFSIGYARDTRGMISMNFGALNKEGGQRRLNVAITRAKQNVKLVGSIVPTDIDLSKTQAEGVRLLRSYIEFAQQGVIALQKELSYSEALEFDSPFEEAVYAFLSSKGYNVTTQVGCSGFKIDMAVKHPLKNGVFAIGIECDGATYHSSRTARERDRLRQDVLEDMGWVIHRIWSTDWIKSQVSEEEKLIMAVEKALGNQSENLENNDIHSQTIELIDLDIEEDITLDSVESTGYGFARYVQANILEYSELSGREIIRKIIEIEQPIHFEELCRRAAPLFGNQKATSKVRTGIERQFRAYFTDDISRNGDFVSLKDFVCTEARAPKGDDDYIRNIAHISEVELGIALSTIAQHSFGITPEDLIIVTARELGYKRNSENITTILRNAYNILLQSECVREVDGKVNVLN